MKKEEVKKLKPGMRIFVVYEDLLSGMERPTVEMMEFVRATSKRIYYKYIDDGTRTLYKASTNRYIDLNPGDIEYDKIQYFFKTRNEAAMYCLKEEKKAILNAIEPTMEAYRKREEYDASRKIQRINNYIRKLELISPENTTNYNNNTRTKTK